ncbi:tRNA pseudouridine(38-40) synthase TruA [Crassaminicella profunda]|uniref:tRNA pseudouridine(38-40) synthase TruA n=1 Tax=Crassaminicella profunda TaxID=1286698 RepID=UPI001CA6F9C9|nr:tRNA pseudouridine(38-40) synthase TruA [Crassaminicella profunda]QZY54798.1 tRNA pseudouridine(38-40) synthase TruA [Crassaminicella profunda]
MRNIKLTIEYDGSKYNGWQRLGNTENTIQGKLESVISRMTNRKVEIIGSGRTDAGVHALGQIANFKTNTNMNIEEIRDYCNEYLPKDIVIKKVEEVDDRFHARYNAKSKKYLYKIWTGKIPAVFNRKYTYDIQQSLKLEAMKKGASYFIGEHDFEAFCSKKSKKKSMVRQIYNIDITREGNEIHILFHGNGFLHNMVRIMVGTLIEIGQGKRKPEDVKEMIASKVRKNAGPTAPARGLFLYEVDYEHLD